MRKDEYRIARLAISRTTMLDLMRGNIKIVDADLPPDVTIRHVTMDIASDSFVLYIESASFDAVLEGELIPMLPPWRIEQNGE